MAKLGLLFYVIEHGQPYAYTIAAFADSFLPTRHQPDDAADVSVHPDVQSVRGGSDRQTWANHWAISIMRADFKMSSLAPRWL
jgi:hypothetical protein